jgi:serine/threonine protein kinase
MKVAIRSLVSLVVISRLLASSAVEREDPMTNERLFDLLTRLEAQDHLTPMWIFYESEENVEHKIDPSRKVRLGPCIAITGTSAVNSVMHRPDIVIKYQGHWLGGTYSKEEGPIGKIHPLVKDFYFLDVLGPLGVSPQVHSLSAPAKITQLNHKTTFNIEPADMVDEFLLRAPILRYLVMERTGGSIDMLLKRHGPQSLVWSLKMGIELIKLLKTLHDMRIIHGDIHQGNVVFSHPSEYRIEEGLKLIDFGRAAYAQSHSTQQLKRLIVHPMFSPWMMENHACSYRDDLYQALQVMAIAMSGRELYEALDRNAIHLSWDENYRRKMDGSIFDYGSFNPLDGAPQTAKDLLQAAENIVKQLEYDELPNYEHILFLMYEVSRILGDSEIVSDSESDDLFFGEPDP